MKILINLFFTLISIFCFQNNFITAQAKSIYTTYTYAQILQDNIYLYKTNLSASTSNAYFEIPKTYFVKLLSNIDDTFFKAQYKDIVGYVLKTSVTPIKETPQSPYLENITFRVYASNGTNILSQPHQTTSATSVGQVELLDPIDYYGKIIGDEYVQGRGITWYYCKYSPLNVKGYLYKGYCDDLQAIPLNTEVVTPTSFPSFDNDDGYLYNIINLTTPLKILLITLIILPCFVIVYLMFKPFDLEKKRTTLKPSKTKNNTINKIQKVVDDEPL